jgi:aerotolerance regulator-like protein
MLWLNPLALFALAAVAAPILIHILIQRRAERFPFPTLRFLQPTRLAAIRRHLLEDLPLVAVRAAVIAVAVAALAGPLLVTAARRQAWDRRIVRAVVTDTAAGTPSAGADQDVSQRSFESASLAEGIQRAILWLDTAPPARREIVIASTFPIGSIAQTDVVAIPAAVGVRFERSGTLPATRTVPAGRRLTPTAVRALDVTLNGNQTSSRDVATGDAIAWPIEVVSSKDERPAVDAAIAAVLSQHVWAPPPDRRARVVLTSEVVQAFRPAVIQGLADAGSIRQPWMADAVSRIARDSDLRAAAARVTTGLSEARFTATPWQTLASAADGRPLVAAAGSPDRLLVASAAPSSDVATPVLLRSIANAIADVPDLHAAEVVPIADAVLQRWTRPAAPAASPRIDTVDRDDRRWLWVVVLCLLALETWIRRPRSADVSRAQNGEQARVA